MSAFVIESGVRLPISQTKRKAEEERRKVFRSYARVYELVNVIKPDAYTYDESSDMITVKSGSRIIERCSPKRLTQLTRMMNNRLRDR